MILEVIKVHKANPVEFILSYNYMAVHTKCVTLTILHTYLSTNNVLSLVETYAEGQNLCFTVVH